MVEMADSNHAATNSLLDRILFPAMIMSEPNNGNWQCITQVPHFGRENEGKPEYCTHPGSRYIRIRLMRPIRTWKQNREWVRLIALRELCRHPPKNKQTEKLGGSWRVAGFRVRVVKGSDNNEVYGTGQ